MRAEYNLRILPQNIILRVSAGETILKALAGIGIMLDAYCGGNGSCGKCKVIVDGFERLACSTEIWQDMSVVLPETAKDRRHEPEFAHSEASGRGVYAAVDIGTTSVAAYLADENGQTLAAASALNPQRSYGADVVTRIRSALSGSLNEQTGIIRSCIEALLLRLCDGSNTDCGNIKRVCIVGNPAMQQLFYGIPPENLIHIPFRRAISAGKIIGAEEYLNGFKSAEILIVPDISAYVGADALAGVYASGMHKSDSLCLLVDIGTNGETVLGCKSRLLACSTAAGPALEGANISCGMGCEEGAIKGVSLSEGGDLHFDIQSGGRARGICGSGLLDAVACYLQKGRINRRGLISSNDEGLSLCDGLSLSQEDIRNFQTAKGAIAAGIHMLAEEYGIELKDIGTVYLAGAFGSNMRAESAVLTGLLPRELEGRIIGLGNAAGEGARRLVYKNEAVRECNELANRIEHIELSSLSGFAKSFARNMYFEAV